jgi:transposase
MAESGKRLDLTGLAKRLGRDRGTVRRWVNEIKAPVEDPEQETKCSKENFKGVERVSRELIRPGEIEVIKDALLEFGDALDIMVMAKQLGRNHSTIRDWIKKIKTNGGKTPVKKITHHTSLEEDLVILDSVVPRLQGRKLADTVFLSRQEWEELGEQLGRGRTSVENRWKNNLQPWLLQHAAGTLNLPVRRMLVTHIAGRYNDRFDIDWAEVATKPEFAGNTIRTLKNIYIGFEGHLLRKYKQASPKDILAYVEGVYKGEGVNQGEAQRERPRAVIGYFEARVEELGITDYL